MLWEAFFFLSKSLVFIVTIIALIIYLSLLCYKIALLNYSSFEEFRISFI